MIYCKKCLMPNTRPGIVFYEDGVCAPCKNYEKQKYTNWEERQKKLEILCDKYRGKYGDRYDCVIAASGGKDSHFQFYYMKEVMGMNPLLVSVGNIEWTETGRKNMFNISDVFSSDVLSLTPNIDVSRKMFKKAFIKIGSPTWYVDALIYAFPYRITMQLGLHLLIYGEDINYVYGGEYNEETYSAKLQPMNDVVKPMWDKWLEEGDISKKELESARQPTLEECEKANLDPIYLSYFVPWSSHHNYEVAKRWGFRHLGHEYDREGCIDSYDQIDSLGYFINTYFKYLKFAHANATDVASKWIRYGLFTREEMISFVEQRDGKLDQGMVEKFCDFIRMGPREFYFILDKWYNRDFFKQDRDGVWSPKFKVGKGII